MTNVIVFGPTGNIGSVVARTAQQHGAKVYLAMRDTTKVISGLSEVDEKNGGYTRVQADMTKPDTVTKAIEESQATRAFIYLAVGMPDAMKSTLEAMKAAGVEFIVFLSSSTVLKAPRDVTPDEIIAYIHARVEINLEEVYGRDNFVAVRPGRFATNLLRHKKDLLAGEVRMAGSGLRLDYITPGDMGTVSGVLLAQGPKDGDKVVYLYGPQILPHKEGLVKLGRVLGKDVNVVEVPRDEGVALLVHGGIPKPVAEYMVDKSASPNDPAYDDTENLKEGLQNVERYCGRPAQTFEDWAKSVAAEA